MSNHCMFYPFLSKDMGEDAGSMIKDTKVSLLLALDMCATLDHTKPSSFGLPATEESSGVDIYKKVLKGLDPNTTLYVCGHASPGGNTFTAPDTDCTITAATLADYLSALPTGWPGRIKIYGCYSGSSTSLAVPYIGWVFLVIAITCQDCLRQAESYAQAYPDVWVHPLGAHEPNEITGRSDLAQVCRQK